MTFSKIERDLIATIYNYNRENKTEYPVLPTYWKEFNVKNSTDFINFVNHNLFVQNDLFEEHPDYEEQCTDFFYYRSFD